MLFALGSCSSLLAYSVADLAIYSHQTVTKVLITEDVNRYGYKPYGLFIPYALANVFTLITVIFGLWSYIHDDVYPDKKFQDIVVAAEDPEIVQIVKNRKRSMTMVVVGDKIVWKAGSEKHQKEALMFWRRFWEKKRRSRKERWRVEKEDV